MILSSLILLFAAISSIVLMPLPVFSSSEAESEQHQQPQQPKQQGLQGQQPLQQTPKQQDMTLLSARLNDDGFGGQEMVGEVKNSGTESARFIQPFVTFRDAQGVVVDTDFTYAEKQRIQSGDTSPFNLFINSEIVDQQAKTYDLSLEWQDIRGNEFTSDVLVNQPFTPGAVNERNVVSFSISSSSSGGGGDDDDNDESCEENPPHIIIENITRPDPSLPPCPPEPPNPTLPSPNQTNPEPEPIECDEGLAPNPSTGQCEPISFALYTDLSPGIAPEPQPGQEPSDPQPSACTPETVPPECVPSQDEPVELESEDDTEPNEEVVGDSDDDEGNTGGSDDDDDEGNTGGSDDDDDEGNTGGSDDDGGNSSDGG